MRCHAERRGRSRHRRRGMARRRRGREERRHIVPLTGIYPEMRLPAKRRAVLLEYWLTFQMIGKRLFRGSQAKLIIFRHQLVPEPCVCVFAYYFTSEAHFGPQDSTLMSPSLYKKVMGIFVPFEKRFFHVGKYFSFANAFCRCLLLAGSVEILLATLAVL